MVKETVVARIVEFFVDEGHGIDAVLTVFEDAPATLSRLLDCLVYRP